MGRNVRKVFLVGAPMLVACLIAVCVVHAKAMLWKFLGMGLASEVSCPVDAVVVLGGGYYLGDQTATERLNGESRLRVWRGVQVYKQCDAHWLVLSGRSATEQKERHAELMRDFAMRSGVPLERILLDTDSANTREHPFYVRSMGLFDARSRLAIVTSPWHLRRALIEFHRYYPLAMPVASYDFSPDFADQFSLWLPQLKSLDRRTMLHEYGGILWYGILRWYSALT